MLRRTPRSGLHDLLSIINLFSINKDERERERERERIKLLSIFNFKAFFAILSFERCLKNWTLTKKEKNTSWFWVLQVQFQTDLRGEDGVPSMRSQSWYKMPSKFNDRDLLPAIRSFFNWTRRFDLEIRAFLGYRSTSKLSERTCLLHLHFFMLQYV